MNSIIYASGEVYSEYSKYVYDLYKGRQSKIIAVANFKIATLPLKLFIEN